MKRRVPTPDELQLWQQVTHADTPLDPQSRARAEMPVAKRPKVTHQMGEWAPALPSSYDHLPLQCGAYAGIDHHTADRFRKGDYTIDATLDLHGMTREKAHHALVKFLRGQYERSSRCLLVITGKGQKTTDSEEFTAWMGGASRGVLRDMLPQWLLEPSLKAMVLAFDVAKPKHGGSGAYYILLRRKRG